MAIPKLLFSFGLLAISFSSYFVYALPGSGLSTSKLLHNWYHQLDLENALFQAVDDDKPEELIYLIEIGANLNATALDRGRNLLMTAIAKKQPNIRIVQLLIDAKVDVDHRDYNGWTSLMECALFNHTTIAQMLIEAGADVNSTSDTGITALMVSSASCSNSIAKMLIEKEALVNANDSNGDTSLMAAVDSDSIEMIALLLDSGADVNLKNRQGMTGLMYAAYQNKIEIIKFLLDSGAEKPDLRFLNSVNDATRFFINSYEPPYAFKRR